MIPFVLRLDMNCCHLFSHTNIYQSSTTNKWKGNYHTRYRKNRTLIGTVQAATDIRVHEQLLDGLQVPQNVQRPKPGQSPAHLECHTVRRHVFPVTGRLHMPVLNSLNYGPNMMLSDQ